MSNVWDRFEGIASADEVLEAKVQSAPLDEGDYKMTLLELKPDESKEGLPKISGKFQMESGKIVYYNQMLLNLNYPDMTKVNIADAVKFFEGLLGYEYEFTSLPKFASDVEEFVCGDDYIINVSFARKDTDKKYPKLKVVEKLMSDDNVPF